MKITFKVEHVYLMNMLVQDATNGAIKAGDKKAAKYGDRLINKFQPNATFINLKKNEIKLIKGMLTQATKMAEATEIPENDDPEEFNKQLENKVVNIQSMKDLELILESKITGDKIVKRDLASLKPVYAEELD